MYSFLDNKIYNCIYYLSILPLPEKWGVICAQRCKTWVRNPNKIFRATSLFCDLVTLCFKPLNMNKFGRTAGKKQGKAIDP